MKEAEERVAVYGTAWCEITRTLRIYLIQNKIAHSFHHVNSEARTEPALLTLEEGRYKVPVVVVDKRIMKNPQLGVLARELESRGLLQAGSVTRQAAGSPLLDDESRSL
jgi:hypothetical protein